MGKIAIFAIASLMPLAAWAQQTIVLRDGTQFFGKLTGVSGDNVSFRDRDGGVRRYDARQIQSIQFDDRGADGQSSSYRPNNTGDSFSTNRGYNQPPPQFGNNNGYMAIPAGTQIAVRTNENIKAEGSNQSRSYSAEVSQDIVDTRGNVVIPRGSDAQLIVRRMNDNTLALDLQSISVNGQRYMVDSGDITTSGNSRQGVGENKRTATFVGGTAVLGTLLGAIAGGGKGAAIGALAGGAAGAGAQVLTRGNQVSVPAETILTFRLDSPMNLNSAR